MEPYETYEHEGVKVEIHWMEFDQEVCDPRDVDGNMSTFYLYHGGYNLGDEQLPRDGFDEIDCPVCTEDTQDDCKRCEGWGRVQPTPDEWAKELGAIAIVPLFVHEHSMLSIGAGEVIFLADRGVEREDVKSSGRFLGDDAGWDTSFSGFAVVTEDNLKEWSERPSNERIAEIVNEEIHIYDLYLQGACYGYVVDPEGEHEESCWGYLGIEESGIKEEANHAAECVAKAIVKEAEERAEWAARDVVTV